MQASARDAARCKRVRAMRRDASECVRRDAMCATRGAMCVIRARRSRIRPRIYAGADHESRGCHTKLPVQQKVKRARRIQRRANLVEDMAYSEPVY